MNEEFETSGTEVRETIAILLRRKLIIAVVAAAFTVLATGMSVSKPKLYDASALVVIRPVISPAAFQSSGFSLRGPLGLDVSADSEALIAGSAVVSDRVRDSMGVAENMPLPAWVRVAVSTEELLQFQATSPSPESAAVVANEYAVQYLNYRRETAEAALRDLAGSLKTRMDTIQSELSSLDAEIVDLSSQAASESNPSRRAQLVGKINQLNSQRSERFFQLGTIRTRYEDTQSSLGRSTGGGEIVQTAHAPGAPSSPKPIRDGILGLLFGLAVGVGLGFLREHFDDRITHIGQASTALGLPVLGVIPLSHNWQKREETHIDAIEDPASLTAQAYRGLRQKLAATGLGTEMKVIAIASISGGAGKTTTTANLGVAFSRTGARVLMVSADLRKPRLHRFFPNHEAAGLAELLQEGKGMAVPVAENLMMVASATTPRNPSELLDGSKLPALIERFRGLVDIVILDCPPMVAGADALVLARQADVTLLLMREGEARVRTVRRAREDLSGAGASIIFGVLTQAQEKSAGYGYGEGERYSNPDAPRELSSPLPEQPILLAPIAPAKAPIARVKAAADERPKPTKTNTRTAVSPRTSTPAKKKTVTGARSQTTTPVRKPKAPTVQKPAAPAKKETAAVARPVTAPILKSKAPTVQEPSATNGHTAVENVQTEAPGYGPHQLSGSAENTPDA